MYLKSHTTFKMYISIFDYIIDTSVVFNFEVLSQVPQLYCLSIMSCNSEVTIWEAAFSIKYMIS